MKKRAKLLLILTGIICIGLVPFWITKEKRNDYEIVSTIKSSFDNYESVNICVVVNKRKYDKEELFFEICAAYWELNEDVDEIHIRLFNGRKAYEKGEVYASDYFFKEY